MANKVLVKEDRICIHIVKKRVGGRVLLEDIALELERKGMMTLVKAESGVGKSVMLNCIYQALRKNGIKVKMISQHSSMYEDFTCQEALRYRMQELYPEKEEYDIVLAVNEMLEKVGLKEHADKKVRILSGGQQKRILLALALTDQYEFLLMDEVDTGLDPANALQLFEMVRDIAVKRGMHVIAISHAAPFGREATINKILSLVDQKNGIVDNTKTLETFMVRLAEDKDELSVFLEDVAQILKDVAGDPMFNKIFVLQKGRDGKAKLSTKHSEAEYRVWSEQEEQTRKAAENRAMAREAQRMDASLFRTKRR